MSDSDSDPEWGRSAKDRYSKRQRTLTDTERAERERKRWVLHSKGGDRLSRLSPKAYDTTIFGVLYVMPGFFERWPNTVWSFGGVAKGIFLGKGDAMEGTWLELAVAV